MNRFRRIAAVALAGVMALSLVACGSAKKGKAGLDDSAALRGADDVTDFVYIDDEKVALAGSASSSAAATSAAQAVLGLINQQRAAAGLGAVVWSDDLAICAQVRASELPTLFSHTRPDGSDWYTVNSDIMYGENLAEFYYTADDVVAAWMDSPTHRANILEPGFTQMGVAVYESPDGKWYWAQEFNY